MPLSDELNSTINRLAELAEQENQAPELTIGDMVTFTGEGGEMSGQIESLEGELAVVRIMAVAGDEYEPTDNVETLALEQLSPLHEQPEPQEQEESDEDEDNEPEQDDDEEEEEEIEKGAFVSWQSKAGKVIGKVLDIKDSDDVIIPETGDPYPSSEENPVALIEVYSDHNGLHEDTGVHVALPVKKLSVTDKPELKAHKLFVKIKKYQTGEDEDGEEKSGWFDGLGGAYGEVDLGGDTVAKGSYKQTISHNDGKFNLMFDHGWGVDKVGGVAYAEDSEEGLQVRGEMPIHIQSVKDVHEKIKFMNKRGKPLGLSIGYWPVKSEPGPNGTRILKEIALEEISITPFPMDTHARIRDAKSRKFSYHLKRKRWQAIADTKTTSDAPTGNQDHQDEYQLLVDVLNETITSIR